MLWAVTEDTDIPEEPTADDGATEPAAVERGRNKHSAPADRDSNGGHKLESVLTALALVIALGALGVGLWVLLRGPLSTASSSSETTTTSAAPAGPNPQQAAEAKKKACDAYNLVAPAVNGRSNATPGTEPEAAGANARIALIAGHGYLIARIDPATPPPLADAIRKYAENIEETGMASLAGVGTDDPAQGGRIQEWPQLNTQITDLCK